MNKVCLAICFILIGMGLGRSQPLSGIYQGSEWLPLLYGKKFAVAAHHASVLDSVHLIDFLLEKRLKPVMIFTPEHGLSGMASAGEKIVDSEYKGIPVISLYGNKKKPTAEEMKSIDLVLFDMQDMGVRFFTYISTLTYLMEACAENKKPIIVLDRPNPHAHYIDGPVLKPGFESYVGLHPVPIVYGLTIGEYARMVNGEGWLKGGMKADLTVVKIKGYHRKIRYFPPIPPSPNLRTKAAMILYPSLCLFEGTQVSVGRGTEKPFEVFGAPFFSEGDYYFIPESRAGATNPPYQGQKCRGFDVKIFAENFMAQAEFIYLDWLIATVELHENPPKLFNAFFDKLAGTDQLRKQLLSGKKASEIRDSWRSDLEQYARIRNKYLLYPD
ncbi:exo-beta-N-acetylmuramidase NamZ family protein [Schleiferia thermophila]|uniref:Uncharacterized protein YbbC (DUF1343 family) n=1 Tax=Schleiferia thermophila TaxID=884107 RepID=A0A369A6S4_9FLAO|nr:DUF1343 domain-containing protein [Schleiferia thermophila]RCX03134.1 uncharacterized protein YbbC (DUF1343 family) [Schleiferia thermophila]